MYVPHCGYKSVSPLHPYAYVEIIPYHGNLRYYVSGDPPYPVFLRKQMSYPELHNGSPEEECPNLSH
jgi:hypothetical protein